jgi:hypothetical protein
MPCSTSRDGVSVRVRPADPPQSFSSIRTLLILHLLVLVAIRVVLDADAFNNWDLVSLVNANAFDSLRALLERSEMHFRQPFSFPVHNTGSESVASILIHRLVAPLSLYWSNVVVLAVYDLVLVAALFGLLRLLFRDHYLESLAWLLLAMSPVLLTFMSTSAFDTQGYATVALALLGSEYVLQARPFPGIVLLLVAYLCISQAYGISFFLPLFCCVWAVARALMGGTRHENASRPCIGFDRSFLLLVVVVGAGAAWAQYASEGGYLRRLLALVPGPYTGKPGSLRVDEILDRVTILLHAAFMPAGTDGGFALGFAPYFAYAALLVLVATAIAAGLRSVRTAVSRWPPVYRRPTEDFRKVAPLAFLAWVGLVGFGYVPALSGGTVKSQRWIFGDVFLAMAITAGIGWLVARRAVLRRTIVVQLLVLLWLSDAYYLVSFASVDHTRNHYPIFDYDTHDGVVRHDLISAIEQMRDRAEAEHAALVVYYPRGYTENRTDPALFFGRFLRHFGRYRARDDLIFACRFCSVRYGCPFPEVRTEACADTCCYRDPMEQIDARPALVGRTLHLWWHDDKDLGRPERRTALLASLERRYRVTKLGVARPAVHWTAYRLTPRVPRGSPKR